MDNIQLVYEILAIAMLTSIIGTIFTYIGMGEEAKNFKEWKKIFLIFALTGAVIHIICEVTNLNKWYCTNGNACKK